MRKDNCVFFLYVDTDVKPLNKCYGIKYSSVLKKMWAHRIGIQIGLTLENLLMKFTTVTDEGEQTLPFCKCRKTIWYIHVYLHLKKKNWIADYKTLI